MCESEDVHTVIVKDEIETKGKECFLGDFSIFTATEGNCDKEFIGFKRYLTTGKPSESPFKDSLLFESLGIKISGDIALRSARRAFREVCRVFPRLNMAALLWRGTAAEVQPNGI